ncbi:MAG: 4-hydroxythreonine-4-phosphate dehydrogenase PdxA [Acidobacteriota bacterium]|nr:4-hydroxythreonine-4-phosphate dehydrogenase PdxA [Blastocatellia bacterium]MDW8413312.1 4-hydroxythreonine-4-phosphate dehydrogenase PdxA [Acidobacteriota bacterium]
MKKRPRIAVTIGDPAGIGPEVVLKAVAEEEVRVCCLPIIVGDAAHLDRHARKVAPNLRLDAVQFGDELPDEFDRPIIYNCHNLPRPVDMGKESAEYGCAAGQYVEAAVELASLGKVDAIATGPINKRSLQLGGYSYPGHSELLAYLTKTSDYAMAIVSASLKVVLLTTHLPLAKALTYVKKERIERTLRLIDREMRLWGIKQPRIAVASVNPHGAEGGLFGIEEAAELIPAIEACRRKSNIDVRGPFSADTVFLRAARGEFDVVLSCYHDQGVIPVKCLSFGEAVNVTLGLPFVRTSVNHGTAFDIAGKGIADSRSMIEAIKLAAYLVEKRREVEHELVF